LSDIVILTAQKELSPRGRRNRGLVILYFCPGVSDVV
jgi:hypothetical protein